MASRGRGARLIVLAVTGWWLSANPPAASAWEQTRWGDVVYYRATFRPPAAGSAVLRVAAADSYQVYLNGALVGADSTGCRLRSYAVSVSSQSNHVGVRVANRGAGHGSGLLAAIEGDGWRVETTPNAALQAWYWTATPQAGTAWTTAAVSAQTGWQPVQAGTLDRRCIEGLVDPSLAPVAGFPGGLDPGGRAGALVLAPVDGMNLARGRFSNRSVVTDGDPNTSWDPPVNAVNHFAAIDLGVRRCIEAVRVVTRGRTQAELDANSLRGYSAQVSDDDVSWREVAVTYQVPQSAWSELRFAPIQARHVRVVIVAVDPTTSPRVGEIEVLGTGFGREGWYVSPVLAAGGGAPANLGRVRWEGSLPAGTGVQFQFRTGATPADFTDAEAGWSAPVVADSAWFPAPEPVALWQYRVRLHTSDERVSPVLERLGVEVDAELPASGARAWVWPNRVPMGVDTTFACRVALEFAPGAHGVERLAVAVPAAAELRPSPALAALLAGWECAHGLLTLRFAAPLREPTEVEIALRTRTYAAVHAFRVYLFAPGAANPLNAAEESTPEPATGGARSWLVRTTTTGGRTLALAAANPPVFTPNGDGVNDDTVIEFALARVDVPRPVRIEVFDLGGRLVRAWDAGPLAAGEYRRPSHGLAAGSPGLWDGTDAAGRLVVPGVYVFRVRAEVDAGANVLAGTVAVAY